MPLEEVLGQAHVRAEAIQLRRATCLPRLYQVFLRSFGVALPQSNPAEHHVAVVYRVAIVPVMGKLRRSIEQVPCIPPCFVNLAKLEGRLGRDRENVEGRSARRCQLGNRLRVSPLPRERRTSRGHVLYYPEEARRAQQWVEADGAGLRLAASPVFGGHESMNWARQTAALTYALVATIAVFGESFSMPPTAARSPTPKTRPCEAGALEGFGADPVRPASRVNEPKKVHHVNAKYPELPRGTVGSGVWVGEALIGPDGRVRKVAVLQDLKFEPAFPQFSAAISDAILQWRYTPTFVAGRAVPVCMTVSVSIHW